MGLTKKYWQLSFQIILFASFLANVYSVPDEYCLSPLNTDDCHGPPTPVFHYYKPGSRCEIRIWRGCPTENKFDDQYTCTHHCIARLFGDTGYLIAGSDWKEKLKELDIDILSQYDEALQYVDENIVFEDNDGVNRLKLNTKRANIANRTHTPVTTTKSTYETDKMKQTSQEFKDTTVQNTAANEVQTTITKKVTQMNEHTTEQEHTISLAETATTKEEIATAKEDITTTRITSEQINTQETITESVGTTSDQSQAEEETAVIQSSTKEVPLSSTENNVFTKDSGYVIEVETT